jgi:hypothetical protein
MILGSNPPRTAEGYWLLDWFGPWIDEEHPLYPTAPGELRWAIYIAKNLKTEPGKMIWVDGPGEYEVGGETYTAMSLHLHPGVPRGQPLPEHAEYRAQLQNLPEPLRSQLLKGDWKAGMQDAPTR